MTSAQRPRSLSPLVLDRRMNGAMSVSVMSAKVFGSLWAPERLLEDYGPGLTKMTDSAEFDFRHEASSARIELKAARAKSGVITFQYVRPDCFDVCVCLRWESGQYRYWLFPAAEIGSLLSKQHRASNSFQLRVGHRALRALAKYDVAPTALRARLEAIAFRSARHRHPVRLDPTLTAVEGWAAVAASITRQLKECGLSDWSFVLKPFGGPMDPEEPDLLPYPVFNEAERRIELSVRSESVIGRQDVAATAGSLFDFLIQYLDRDALDIVDPAQGMSNRLNMGNRVNREDG